ncbi:hypothetical protein C8A05DRAFT_47740 [Staphylotrichum tortipilum]|uniref:C2H2-type domain-containing protein n=1 Tax=Staphylotrichum tortipilum TaxID=2831512 RepID=A0AAN6RNL8_9PEZI|nr:hypothetical protein C8A05DRAFT_47740 [Staphylotrichum longicolle]
MKPAPIRCGECKLEVGSNVALAAHWREHRDSGRRHFHCAQCMRFFHSEQAETRHHHEFHAAKQDLACPGCHDRFVSAAGLMGHIEKNRCKRIKNNELAAQREKRLVFARELQRRHFGDDPALPPDNASVSASAASSMAATSGTRRAYNFTQFLSTARDVPPAATPVAPAVTPVAPAVTPGLSALRPKADTTVRPNPVIFAMKTAELPQVAVDHPTPSTPNQPANAWAQKKNLFPDAPTAVRPPPETLQALEESAREPARKPATPGWPPHDPRSPGWDPKQYFVSYINKYKCPHDRCPKSFPNAGNLRTHLLSDKHTSLIKVQCPRCCKWFDSTAALTAHAESQGVRCVLRETNGYRQFLDQLTAGILDTTERHHDGTDKYSVPAEARATFGIMQGGWDPAQSEWW